MFPGVKTCDVLKLLSSGSETKGVSKSEGESGERKQWGSIQLCSKSGRKECRS